MKKFVFVILFFAFFLGEIAVSFSFKHEEKRNIPSNSIVPLSHKISNEISYNANTRCIDSLMGIFMHTYKIKGASMAVTSQGKLVYAKGFGYADAENEIPAEPKNLFRVASVSKLITAVAIMKLNEEGYLSIHDKVFGTDGLLTDPSYLDIRDSRMEQITVFHLLNHTAGWSKKSPDPLFQSLSIARKMNVEAPVDMPTIIQYVLSKRLDFTPGRKYSYSNFGYALLGEIIEKVTGMEYEAYVKFAILQPLGIYDMHIGHSYYADHFPNEVKYYEEGRTPLVRAFDGSGKAVPMAYGGNNIQLLGAAGGWVASAPELIKLLVAIDGFKSRPDILTDESIKLMTNTSHYKLIIGWRGTDGFGTWWRTGTLSGTTALAMRNRDEINWVVLLNTSAKRKSRIHNDLSKTMFSVLRNVEEWPEVDLFNYYAKN